ncbi:hypothetical protein HN937_02940, partial [Candidatus Poribacteria bacterium]|nr:hypothetical protein [Candidatus Poribacteria bacterium]
MKRRFTKNDLTPLTVGRLWGRLRTHFVDVGIQSLDQDAVIRLLSPDGEFLPTDHELRKDAVYTIEVDDDHSLSLETFFAKHANFTLMVDEDPPQPAYAQELGPPEPGLLRIGGTLSPRPSEYLYAYVVNANDPIATVRSGGVTHLPNGTSAVIFETGFTFDGSDEVNDILRYWVAAMHHSPIMEIEQDDLEYLVTNYRQTGREDLFRSNRNENHGDLVRLYRELVDLIGNRDYIISELEYRKSHPGVSLEDAAVAIGELIDEITKIVNATRNAADLSGSFHLRRLSEFQEQLTTRRLTDTKLWALINEILVKATTVTDVLTQVAELRAEMAREEGEAKPPGLIQGKRRLMVAVQNYRIMTIPGSPNALQLQMAMLLVNEDQITPDFRYWAQDGSKVQNLEESAFPHWVHGSLMVDSGVPDDVFVAERSGRTHASVQPFYFSEWAPTDDTVLYCPSVEKLDDGMWESTNLFRSAAARALNFGDRAAVGRFSLSTSFQVTPIPVESDLVPMYQYLGMYTQEAQMEFATPDRDLLQELNQVPSQLAALAKQQQQVELPFLVLRHPIANMVDFRQCVIQGIEIKDEPDSTDTWVGTCTLARYSAKQIRNLDSPMRTVNRDRPSPSFTLDEILRDPEAEVYRAAIQAVLDSVWMLQTIEFPPNVLELMMGFRESNMLKLGQLTGALPDFRGKESTERDVTDFLLGAGLWIGEGEQEHAAAAIAVLGILAELTEKGYELIPIAESDPRFRETPVDLSSTAYRVPTASPFSPIGPTGAQKTTAPDISLPLRARSWRTDFGSLLRRYRGVVYDFDVILDNMTTATASTLQEAVDRVVPNVPGLEGAHAFLLRKDGVEMGYAEAVLREIAVPVLYYRTLLNEHTVSGSLGDAGAYAFSLRGRVAHQATPTAGSRTDDPDVRRRSLEEAHEKAATTVREYAEGMGFPVPERPVLDEQVMALLNRVGEALSQYQVESMDLRTMSTDPIFGGNFSTYPDLRLPQFLDYILLLRGDDQRSGKTPASYMAPDWHYCYEDALSAADGIYEQV